MRCGKCKTDGVDVAHVRGCYGTAPDEAAQSPLFNTDKFTDHGGMKPVEPVWPASTAQIEYVIGLQDERVLPDNYTVYDRAALKTMERDEVSGAITMLKSLSRKDKGEHGRKTWSMPEGRYALVNSDGVVDFYEVSKPERGRWVGYTFIKRLVGAPGDFAKYPVARENRERLLAAIERDPQEAAIRFGDETRTCFRCGSALTDPASLARSMGPICAAKSGW